MKKNLNARPVGRPTELTVSVVETRNNKIVYTGSVGRFVTANFKYCSDKAKRSAKAEMYKAAQTGTTAFRGKVKVFYN